MSETASSLSVWVSGHTFTTRALILLGIAVVIVYLLLRRGWETVKLDVGALPIIVDHIVFSLSHIPFYVRLQYCYRTDTQLNDSRRPARHLLYGSQSHQALDVYTPYGVGLESEVTAKRLPVIVFIYGGAWQSGSKDLYYFMARELRSHGYVVVVPNYILYPYAECPQMLTDIDRAVQWTFENVSEWGGDITNISLMGHSAGAHLSSLLVLNKAIEEGSAVERTSEPDNTTGTNGASDSVERKAWVSECSWSVGVLRRVINLGAPQDIADHYVHEESRSVAHISGMKPAMQGHSNFELFSPTRVAAKLIDTPTTSLGAVEREERKKGVRTRASRSRRSVGASGSGSESERVPVTIPHFYNIHSYGDIVVPPSSAIAFDAALRSVGVDSSLVLLEVVTHAEMVMSLFDKGRVHYDLLMRVIDEAVNDEL